MVSGATRYAIEVKLERHRREIDRLNSAIDKLALTVGIISLLMAAAGILLLARSQ